MSNISVGDTDFGIASSGSAMLIGFVLVHRAQRLFVGS